MSVWEGPQTENPVTVTFEPVDDASEFHRFRWLTNNFVAVPRQEIDEARENAKNA